MRFMLQIYYSITFPSDGYTLNCVSKTEVQDDYPHKSEKNTTWYEYLRANLAFKKSWNRFLSSSNSVKTWGQICWGFFGLIFWIHGVEGLNCCNNWKYHICSEWLFLERLKDNIKCYCYDIKTNIFYDALLQQRYNWHDEAIMDNLVKLFLCLCVRLVSCDNFFYVRVFV
jgi:hypothetical protein